MQTPTLEAWRNPFAGIALLGCILSPGVAGASQQAGAAAASAQTGTGRAEKSAPVMAISSNIAVDGALDEEAWRLAQTIGDFTQRIPRTGEPPTETTDVTLLRDADYLYVGVLAHDSEPRRVIGTQMGRDAGLTTDDRVEIILDTYRDQRNAFYFATNPAGALVDGLVFANGQTNMDWDAIWTVRTRRTDQGWSAEFAIPFKSLGFPEDRTVWGFNISRHVVRKIEETRWTGARIEVPFFQVSEAGEITELTGMTQGIGLEIRPFAGARWVHTTPAGNDGTGKPGLDMFYNITPALKLTGTVNTDFGETEADARQINLSRFSLFFPEKRTFFLEDAGVFSFSNTTQRPPGGIPDTQSQVIPFFSRQVGLLAGEEVPLDGGVKLTGKIGRTDVGVLDVRTRDTSAVTEKNFFVGRVKRNLLRQSYVGAMFTTGHPALDRTSSTFGADLRLGTSRFLGNKNLVFNAYGLKSQNEGISANDMSYGVSLEYPNNLLEPEFIWREVQQNFRPSLGFVSRNNIRLFRVGSRYNPRPKKFLNLEQMFHGVYYTRFTRLDNDQVESWALNMINIDWHFRNGDQVHSIMWPTVIYERLFAPFQISRGVFLPVGEYRFTRWKQHVATAQRRRWQVNLQWVFGHYWSGKADEVTTGFTYKIPPRFNITFTANQTFAKLPQGHFVARVISTQVNYSASPFVSLSNLIQYDNLSRNLGWQSRLRWILQPGNDLFLVFSQGWIQEPTGGYNFDPQSSKLSSKVQYTFRF